MILEMIEHICACGTSNLHLRTWIGTRGRVGICDICGRQTEVVDAREFATYIDDIVRRHTTPIVNPGPEDEGEAPLTLIRRVTGVDDQLAEYILHVGRQRCEDELCPYDYNLSFVITFERQHREDWKRFQEQLRHDARYFGSDAHATLDRLLGDVERICDGAALRELTPEDIVYRGRLERVRGDAERFFQSPATELVAPPASKARAGRMNSAGIRVFYGALTEGLCIAELRPPLSARIVTGRFRPMRTLRVVDLGSLGGAFSGALDFADLFDPDFDALSGKLEFLRSLESEIARPILPHDEELEYLPTQVIAEYLVNVVKVDGIAYRSAQAGRASQWEGIVDPRAAPNERNIALFRSAGRTADEQPDGSSSGLRFEAGSEHMLNVSRISIETEENMWAHYPDAPEDPDE